MQPSDLLLCNKAYLGALQSNHVSISRLGLRVFSSNTPKVFTKLVELTAVIQSNDQEFDFIGQASKGIASNWQSHQDSKGHIKIRDKYGYAKQAELISTAANRISLAESLSSIEGIELHQKCS